MNTISPVTLSAVVLACGVIAPARAEAQQSPASLDRMCSVTVPLPAPAAGAGGQQGGGANRGGGGGAAPVAAPSPTELRLVRVRDDVYVIQNPQNTVAQIGALGGNVTVYLTDEGVVLFDSKNERTHDEIVARVKTLTDKPIKYVVLTHNHGDHSAGAAKLQQLGATIVISRDDRENLRRTTPAGSPLPQLTFSRNASVFLGGKEVQLTEYCGHTRGDTVGYLPAARVVIAGDLVTTPDTIPQIVNYGDGGNWTDMLKTLDAIAAMDFDVLIGGHGPVLTKQEFLQHKAKLTALRDRARTLVKEGHSQEEITQALLKEFNYGTGPAAGNIPGMMAEFR